VSGRQNSDKSDGESSAVNHNQDLQTRGQFSTLKLLSNVQWLQPQFILGANDGGAEGAPRVIGGVAVPECRGGGRALGRMRPPQFLNFTCKSVHFGAFWCSFTRQTLSG